MGVSAEEEADWWSDPPGGRRANAHGVPAYDVNAVALRIIESLLPNALDTILDLGCGQGRTLQAIRDRSGLVVIGVDSSPEMVEDARVATDAAIFHCDGRTIPPIHPLHHAYAVTLFQHLEHDVTQSYIKQVFDLLEPGGRFVFTHSVGTDPQSFLHHQVVDPYAPFGWAERAGFGPVGLGIPVTDERGWSWYLLEKPS